ncbi:hypothetical protein BGZ76_001069 [Entomortierella beljakovae]|nr:hypothetical protein BGZ76_001069 [Entomortierella beljakovae]
MSDPTFTLSSAISSVISPTATTTDIFGTQPTTTSLLIPTYVTPTPTTIMDSPGGGPLDPSQIMLCDWIRSASDCRDADFIRNLLIASSAMHGFTFLFGCWLLAYRNRGLNSKMFTQLYSIIGTGVRPKPMDCIIFFTSLASLVKIGVNIPLILDVLKDTLWIRILIEQTYWIIVAIGFSSYFVGLLYAMPVTKRDGVFAVYQPEAAFDSKPLPPIHVLTPSTVQKNIILIMGAIYPAIFASAPGVVSAYFAQQPGNENLSKIFLIVQYSNWVLILYAMSALFFYYGLKYTFILQANIIIAEAALKAPKAAFGISNLRSASPARFLFIQLQITGFGGAAATLLAGTLCMIWVICREKILAMEHDEIPHTIAFLWTCAMAVCFFVFMYLIAVQSVRSRKRDIYGTSTPSNSYAHDNSGQKNSSLVSKNMYSSWDRKNRTESEARLAQTSSADLSTLHSDDSLEKESYEIDVINLSRGGGGDMDDVITINVLEASQRMDHNAFNISHNANKREKERLAKEGLGSPSRPFVIQSRLSGNSVESSATFGRRGSDSSLTASVKPTQDIRQAVFGGRTNKHESTSPMSPSFPLAAIRSPSKHATGKHGGYNRDGPKQGSKSPSPIASYQTGYSDSSYAFPDDRESYIHNMVPKSSEDAGPFPASITTIQVPPPASSGLARDTFLGPNGGLDMDENPHGLSQYSHVPRVGGGVRRKSIKN